MVNEPDVAKVMIYGVGIRSHTGVVQKMFGALAEKGINIDLISTSEICVSVVVKQKYGEAAVKALLGFTSRQAQPAHPTR